MALFSVNGQQAPAPIPKGASVMDRLRGTVPSLSGTPTGVSGVAKPLTAPVTTTAASTPSTSQADRLLTVTPRNPDTGKPLNPTTSAPLDLNKALGSGGLTYDSGPAIPFTKPAPAPVNGPSVINALKGSPDIHTAMQPSGFGSSNPDTQSKIATMNQQALANSSQAKPPLAGTSPGLTGPTADELRLRTNNLPDAPAPGAPSPSNNLAAQRAAVLAALGPNATETQLNDELAQFKGSAAEGIAGLEGQGRGIPLDLVRGQQAQLQTQANLKEQTLMDRIAAQSASRQQALTAAQAQLGFTEADIKSQQDAASANKPLTIGNSLVQLNPATGKYETVYSPPPTAEKPVTLSAGQSLVDPSTGQVIATLPTAEPNAPATVQEYQYAQQQGFGGSFLDYQKAKAQASAGPKVPTADQSKAAGFADRVNQSSQVIDQLGSQFTGVGSLIGQALPDIAKGEDRKLLEQAETNFVNAVLRRESGSAISSSEFDSARKQYFPQPGDTPAVLAQKQANRESVLKNLQNEASGTPIGGGDEIDKFLDSFSSAPSTAIKGSAQSIANAIKQVESGGNYSAVGGSGEHGAYQFMPSSWSAWAGQYLGNANAPMTPQNQDKVAMSRIQSLLDQGYNPQQVALIWNGGSPNAKQGTNQYGVAYDSGAYANKVLNALG